MGVTRAGSSPAADVFSFIYFSMGQVFGICCLLSSLHCNVEEVVDYISLFPPYPPFCMFLLCVYESRLCQAQRGSVRYVF